MPRATELLHAAEGALRRVSAFLWSAHAELLACLDLQKALRASGWGRDAVGEQVGSISKARLSTSLRRRSESFKVIGRSRANVAA